MGKAQKPKHPLAVQQAGVRSGLVSQMQSEPLDGPGMIAGNTRDVGAGDAEIVQLTVVESGELTDGLLVGGPLLQRRTNTHLEVSFAFTGEEIVLFGGEEQRVIPHARGAADA